jgi:hypothetical protein
VNFWKTLQRRFRCTEPEWTKRHVGRRLPVAGRRPELPQFPGARWPVVKKPERRQYLKNAYRVLLTRARQGMVIFVPPAAKRDKTRSLGFYEGVNQYLTELGVPKV